MVSVSYEEQRVALKEEETVLDVLLGAGYTIPNACRAGACQSCLMQATDGTLPARSQSGLKETQKAQGYFLACCCQPESDLVVQRVGAVQEFEATLISKELLPGSVLRMRLQTPLNYNAGQYVNLVRADGLSRAYSIASVPGLDNYIELQIRIYPDGQFSQWACQDFNPGDSIKIQGPFGDCFYSTGVPEQPIILAGTGTGMAPLYGILRDALQQGHRGTIHLFVGARTTGSLYLNDELRMLETDFPQFRYTPVVLEADANAVRDGMVYGDLNVALKSSYPDTKGFRAYFCGSELRVKTLRKQTFLSGADMKDIYCDLFTIAA